tara:strand:+ start:130180 stop:131118 length:939 start_codon:yes stop_codon:yes gene_type:complete
MASNAMKTRLATAARIVGALAVLALTFYFVDAKATFERLRTLDVGWLALGVFLSAVHYFVVALRWWHVAGALDIPLRLWRAVADYFLGGFANQALPTGLAGAALRVVRHARRLRPNGEPVGAGAALTAVVLERLAGLAVLALAALVGACVLVRTNPMLALISAGTVVGLAAVTLFVFSLAARRSRLGRDGFASQARLVLFANRAWLHHLVISTCSVFLLCAGFYCAARAGHVDVSFARALIVTPIILASMVIPLAIAGWGIREAAAAALFSAMGLDASMGVAVSVSFGLIGLVASLPGALVWLAPERQPAGS